MTNGKPSGTSRRVAVAPDLGPVREELRRRGYRVEDLPKGQSVLKESGGLCALVVTGLSDDLMGMISMQPDLAVLRAGGKTPQDIAQEVEAIARAQESGSGSGVP